MAVVVVIAALVAGCGGHGGERARHADAQPAAGSAQLEVVGDSLAAGRFAGTQEEAFPQLVAAALGARLELLAVPGVTTGQLAAQPVPPGGNVVVVEAGTNDLLAQTPRRRFADDYRARIANVRAGSPGARLVCLTVWVPDDVASRPAAKIPPSFYDATIRRACSGGSVADISSLVDAPPPTRGPAGRPTFLGPGDDFHPNSAGHAAIARAIEAQL